MPLNELWEIRREVLKEKAEIVRIKDIGYKLRESNALLNEFAQSAAIAIIRLRGKSNQPDGK